MEIKILKTKKDYNSALRRLEELFHAKPGTPDSDEADLLALLISSYEDKHFVIAAPSPLEAIRYRMEQQGLTNVDLARILGYKSRVSDLFNRRRKLNVKMVRKLHRQLNIPLETLIKEY